MNESVLTTGQQLESLWALGGLSWTELLKRVWGGINRNDLINRAYELAYNFLLAVFPMLLFLLGLLGMLASEGSEIRTDLFHYFQLVLPPAAYDLLTHTLREVTPNSSGGKLTFGLLFALYSGSGGMTQLMSTLNSAYEVKESRSWLRVHLISLALTLAMSILVILAMFLLVNIWATWCEPCKSEMPKLDRLYRERKDQGFIVFGCPTRTLRCNENFWKRSR